jgi:hypothetical protein
MKGCMIMAEFVTSHKSMFDAELDMLVNLVNCKGVTKSSLAAQFSKRFPRSQENYVAMTQREITIPDATGRERKQKAFQPGDVLHYVDMDVTKVQKFQSENEDMESEDLQNFINAGVQNVIYMPIRNHWKRPAKLDYFKRGLKSLRKVLDNEEMPDKVKTVGIPFPSNELDEDELWILTKDILGDLDYKFTIFPLE